MTTIPSGLNLRVDIDGRAVADQVGPDASRNLRLLEQLALQGTVDDPLLGVRTELTVTDTAQSLDLAGGATDPITGGAQTFAELQGFAIRNTGAADVRILGAAANGVAGVLPAATDYLVVKAGGLVVWYAPVGVTITAATGDLFGFVTASGTSTVDVLLWGE